MKYAKRKRRDSSEPDILSLLEREDEPGLNIVKPVNVQHLKGSGLCAADLMRIIGTRLQRIEQLKKDPDTTEEVETLQAIVLDDAVQYLNRFLFSVIGTAFIALEKWKSCDEAPGLIYFKGQSLRRTFPELEPYLFHWLASPRRRQYNTVDRDRSLRTLKARAFLLEGPVHIPELCDIVDAFGREFKGHCIRTLMTHEKSVIHLAAHTDGRWASADDCSVRMWEKNTCVQRLAVGKHIWSLLLMADGTLLLGHNDATVSVWKGGVQLGAFACSSGVKAMVELPDSEIATGETALIFVWRVQRYETGSETGSEKGGWKAPTRARTLMGHAYVVNVLVALPESKLASASDDGTVRVWCTVRGECLQILRTDDSRNMEVCSLIALPGDLLASGCGDHMVRIWNSLNGDFLRTLKGHTGWVYGLALLHDGNLASGSWDLTVRVWDWSSGACLLQLKGHTDFVQSLMVRSDGKLVSGSSDTMLCVWA